MDLGISGKRALVAAGSAGLGLATAQALVREGVRVAICGRDEKKLRSAQAILGDGTVAIIADLGDPAEAARFVDEGRSALGGCDILIANAGGPPPGTFASTTLDAYQHAFDLDCRSAIAMCQNAIPHMIEQQWGRVVAITSIGAKQPIGGLAASSVARAAITSFLKITAREVASHGVTVNNLCPGFHATDRLTGVYDATTLEALTASVPAGKLGDPVDFGSVAAFLCSQSAKYLTGTSIQVDGGTLAGLL